MAITKKRVKYAGDLHMVVKTTVAPVGTVTAYLKEPACHNDFINELVSQYNKGGSSLFLKGHKMSTSEIGGTHLLGIKFGDDVMYTITNIRKA